MTLSFAKPARRNVALALAITLAACSKPPVTDTNLTIVEPGPDTPDNLVAPTPADTPSLPTTDAGGGAPADTNGNTIGGDGSAIRLSPLSAKDIAGATLEGELACSFTGGDGKTLILAKGSVASRDAALGIVKVADSVERIAAPGGFDGMFRGASFTGQGKTIHIALTDADASPVGSGESPPHPATLTYDRADGAKLTLAGAWTCGP